MHIGDRKLQPEASAHISLVIKRLNKYRTPTISKMEPIVTKINGFESLTIIKKGSMLHVARDLHMAESLAVVETVKTFKIGI